MRAPRPVLAATTPLRRPVASVGWSWVRLGLYVAAVVGAYLWAGSVDPRGWVAVVLAAGPAVVLSPMALLALWRITAPRDAPED